MVVVESIGEQLRRLRQERGLTLREMAVDGLSWQAVARIESGERQARVSSLVCFAAVLDVEFVIDANGLRIAQ